ncbi:leishmanolysin-related zinc metalloendopeptidase [Deinococcus radiotolerans]|uniref:Zinc metalloendopeptidase n=1 Tax=Deinococcus radiotolerans TaxID=1309407 RepID=A0ABQ2FQA2_9DEIO|nr:leishmanolysin-related zinc metalloendopeptidase [Deinococcus radiotolerans]GGL16303.1 zinc metalloendopeptidase [Deinococcus radiotolerans]
MRRTLTLSALLSLTALLASCGSAPASVQAAEPAPGTVNVADLPVDPYAKTAALQPQATEAYNITLNFASGSDSSVVNAMKAAASRWQGVITQGQPDLTVSIPAGSCGSNAAYSGTIDDIMVFTGNKSIDGPGGILAQSGPCSVRSSTGLTTYSTLVFDTADLANFSSQLSDIAVHELGHSLGIGSLWSRFGLVSGVNTTNPIYKGTNGVREYRAAGGTLSTVPVENQGGSGTKGAHWRETTFKTELMTGYLNSGVKNPLSRISVGSLQDMGYAVNYAAADAYTVPTATAQTLEGLDLGGREQIITPRYRTE